MDALDRAILAQLQHDGRLSVTELASAVGLTVSPCHRRLRELERAGVIRGYRADIDSAAVGLAFQVLVFVTLRQEDRETLAAFDADVAAIPNIVDAERLFGDPDYLLRVVTSDLESYQRLYEEQLGEFPGVQRLNSTIVMKQVVQGRALPL